MSESPCVSIGLAVYNGEKYLKKALDSIITQTFTDLELIISDNFSTDNTQQICEQYASQDERIRYYRNNKNIGAPRNFNRAFELASGKYFKWAASDDVLAPDFLRKCVAILDKDASVVLCHSITGRIDENGDLLRYTVNTATGNVLCWNSIQAIYSGGVTGTSQQQWKPRIGGVIDAVNDTSWLNGNKVCL